MINKIDMQSFSRKNSYNHYFDTVPCTFSMTVNLDITNFFNVIKSNNKKFFPITLYAISKIVNSHKEFRMDLYEEKNLVYYDFANPCYTVFHNETETITNIWTEYTDDLEMFIDRYNDDMLKYRKDFNNSKPMVGKNYFNVSCMPWTSFTGFNLNLQKGYDHLLPIFTMGKYSSVENKIFLPLAVQVHHAVCDGFHLSRFINELQDYLNSFIL